MSNSLQKCLSEVLLINPLTYSLVSRYRKLLQIIIHSKCWDFFQDYSCRLLTFFSKLILKNPFFKNTFSVKQFGPRSGLMFYWTLSGKDHQQTTEFAAGRQSVKYYFYFLSSKLSLYPPQTLFIGGILFSRCPSVRPSVRNALFP